MELVANRTYPPPCLVTLNLSDVGRTFALSQKERGEEEVGEEEALLLSPVLQPNVPGYTLQGIWWLVWMVCLEYLALWWQGQRLPDLHDNVLSLVHATLYEVSKVFVRGFEYGAYVYVWSRYSFFPTPDDSLLSLLLMVVVVDFGFYWLHRASHEVMVLWAVHQVHHSSEEFSMSVGLRHSPLQRLFSWVFYLPLALFGIPPTLMLGHIQFNTLFQCWTHTETIRTVGPLEYIFNTPSHHRVHHGCNIYCLDKNYGGIFILWDRLFGTFQEERTDQEIVYGIVFQPKRFNPLYHQIFYLMGALKKAQSLSTWSDSVAALIKGPSWAPGSPWTGWVEDKLDIRGPREHVPVSAVLTTHCYVVVHFLAALSLTSYLAPLMAAGLAETLVYSIMVVASLTSIGILYEDSPYARPMELTRCGVSLALCMLVPLSSASILMAITTVYAASFVLWGLVPDRIMGHKV